MKIVFCLLPIVIAAQLSFAQADKDLSAKDVPAPIKDYLKDNYPEAQRIEYFKEIEKDSVYYESEFKYKNDTYNLRFLSDGTLYETEIYVKFEDLPTNIKENISKDLCDRFSKFRIKESQKVNPDKELKYEISLRGKKGKHAGYFELFYDKNGNFISETEQVLRSVPNNSGF